MHGLQRGKKDGFLRIKPSKIFGCSHVLQAKILEIFDFGDGFRPKKRFFALCQIHEYRF